MKYCKRWSCRMPVYNGKCTNCCTQHVQAPSSSEWRELAAFFCATAAVLAFTAALVLIGAATLSKFFSGT